MHKITFIACAFFNLQLVVTYIIHVQYVQYLDIYSMHEQVIVLWRINF